MPRSEIGVAVDNVDEGFTYVNISANSYALTKEGLIELIGRSTVYDWETPEDDEGFTFSGAGVCLVVLEPFESSIGVACS